MLTTSLVAGRARSVPRPFAMFGAVAGPVLMVSFLGPEALYPSFLLVPAWMIWLGIVLLKRPAEGRQPVPAAALRAATP